jgi:hypothetical protein
MLVIPALALRKMRQKDPDFEASMGNMVSYRLV